MVTFYLDLNSFLLFISISILNKIRFISQQEAWRLYAELLYVIEICNHFVHMFESVYIIFL